MRIILAVTVAIAFCAGAGRTWAQSASNKAVAEQLFQEARELMAQAHYEEAIPKLQASLDLARGSGTLGSLAVCYEQLGKLASAWVHYKEASVHADREGNPNRAKAAQAQAAALEPRLPRLTIRVASSDTVPGLAISRDGNVLTPAMLGIAVYVDPGEHEVTATAQGYQPFSNTFTMAEAETHTVEIPMLSPLPKPVPGDKPDIPSSSGQPGLDLTGAAADLSDGEDPGRTRRMAGLITGGAGAVVLTVGLVVGATVYSAWNDPFDRNECDRDTLVCTPEGQEQVERARSRANLSNLLVGTGVAAVATGAVLYFTAPKSRREQRDARLVPIAGPDSLGVALVGGF
jgi:serine/threonine-protein kinase